MADQVEISNVGGEGGVASEATLAGLTRSIERLAASTGRDPKSEAGKVQRMHTRTLREDIKAIEDKIDAQEEYTSVLRSSTRMMGGLLSGISNLITGGIGLLTSSVVQFADTVISGDESLSGLVKSIPVFGSVLSRFTDVIDESFDAFQTMATSGASFAYDLGELRSSARELRLGFSELSSFVTQNSTRLAAFGGTVDGGIRATRALTTALGSDVREQFTAMGLTAEELNEQLSFFQFVTRAGARQDQLNRVNQADAVASFTQNMLTLSKLTGQDIRQRRDAIAQAQMDMAFQMEMARLEPAQRAAMQEALNQAQVMGQDAVDAVKREFLGMPPLTEAQAIYAATQSELVRELGNMVHTARNIRDEDLAAFQSEEAVRQRLANLFEAQIEAANRNETLLRAGAAGLGGVASTVAEQFGTTAEFVSQFLSESADGTIEFARDRFLTAMEEAGNEMVPTGGELDAVSSFREALREAREAITNSFTNPMLNALSPALTSVADAFNDFVGENGENTRFQNAIGVMREKIEALVPKINQFLEAFAADPEQAIADLVEDISNFFRDAIFGQLTNVIQADETGALQRRQVRQGGLIQGLRNAISSLFSDQGVLQSLINGISTVTSGLNQGFSEFWNSPESNQLREDIKSLFRDLLETMQETFVNSFLARTILGIDRQEVAERASTRETPVTVDEGENFARAVFEQLQERSARTGSGARFTEEELERFYESLGEENARLFQEQMASNRSFMDSARSIITGLEEGVEIGQLAELAASGQASQEQLDLLREIYRAGRDTGIFDQIEGFNNGTVGFRDFGSGTLAMLHGREAVIPLDSPLGQMIANINSGAAISNPDISSLAANFNPSATLANSRISRMPGLDFDSREDTRSDEITKVEIDNITLLTENIQDMKNELVKSLNTANQGSQESFKQLNRLMSQMLAVLEDMAEDADNIERNTRSNGSNIANGRISSIR